MTHVPGQHSNAAHCDAIVKMGFFHHSLKYEKAVGCEVLDDVMIEDEFPIFAVSTDRSALQGNRYPKPRKSPSRRVSLDVERLRSHSWSVQAQSVHGTQTHASCGTNHDWSVKRPELTLR